MSDRARGRAFLALCLARLREYYREPEVLFWGFVFPLLLSGALAVAFRDRPPEPSRVTVLEGPGNGPLLSALRAAPLLDASPAGEEEAAAALRMGRTDVVVSRPGGRRRRSSTASTPRGPRRGSPVREWTTPSSGRRAAWTP